MRISPLIICAPLQIIVEKDYYAIQLIKTLSTLSFEGYELVFAGGTCLAKVHFDTFRMSEDIDIKLVPPIQVLKYSRNHQRELRKKFIKRHILYSITILCLK